MRKVLKWLRGSKPAATAALVTMTTVAYDLDVTHLLGVVFSPAV